MAALIIGTYRDDEMEPGRPLTTAIGPLLRDVGAVDLRPRLLTSAEVEAVAERATSGAPVPVAAMKGLAETISSRHRAVGYHGFASWIDAHT